MSDAKDSVRRTVLVAHNTLREAMRQKLYGALLLLAFLLVAGVQYLRDFSFGAPELKFIADAGFGAIGLFGAVIAVNVTVQLFFSELEHGTVRTLLARPMRRGEFMGGKLVGSAVLTACYCAILTGLLGLVLWARETTLMRENPEAFSDVRLVSYAAVAATGLLLWLKLLVLGALTLLVASYAQSATFAAVCGYLLMVICHLRFLADAAVARGSTPAMRVAARLAGWAFPDFQVFDAAILTGRVAWAHIGGVTLYALGYVAAAGALASLSFRRREL